MSELYYVVVGARSAVGENDDSVRPPLSQPSAFTARSFKRPIIEEKHLASLAQSNACKVVNRQNVVEHGTGLVAVRFLRSYCALGQNGLDLRHDIRVLIFCAYAALVQITTYLPRARR